MAKRKFGSKASYEAYAASRRALQEQWLREANMTDEERRKERNKEQLLDQEMMHFSMFAMAALAGGADLKKATGTAEAAIAELKKRFT